MFDWSTSGHVRLILVLAEQQRGRDLHLWECVLIEH